MLTRVGVLGLILSSFTISQSLADTNNIDTENSIYIFTNQEVQKELDSFTKNPKIYQETPPLKKDGQGRYVTMEYTYVPPQRKFSWRQIFFPPRNNPRLDSEPTPNDSDRDLMEDGGYVETIQQMDRLRSGIAGVKPWSDDYWAYYRGGAGARYADPAFPNSNNWEQNYRYIKKNPFTAFFSGGRADNLSATEKYDLLYDGSAGVLTQSAWNDGQGYFRESGRVETWMGLCHGWAPASYLAPRPTRSVEVMAFDGKTTIRFYPADIKALTTLLWANARVQLRNAGGRCNERSPRTDGAGRAINPDCRDNNPSTWHRAIVNRLGLSKRSFVMDSTWDYQVWNQPLISYRYRYFNPQTKSLKEDLKSASVHVSQFGSDIFRRYRARGTSFVVGISMEVTYGMERRPDHRDTDGPEFDQVRTVLYNYDLELDSQGVVIGGEWHKKLHPDFLWTPTKDAKPLAQNDVPILGEPLWDGRSAIPSHWKTNARNSAGRGQPLAKIIDSLLAISGSR